MKTAEEILLNSKIGIKSDWNTEIWNNIIQAMHDYASSRSIENQWISVEERLPENPKEVLGYCKGTIVCFYTKGHEVEYEDEDFEGEYDEYEDAKGALFLKAGWYQHCEQKSGDYDYLFIKREITHWREKPQPPTK